MVVGGGVLYLAPNLLHEGVCAGVVFLQLGSYERIEVVYSEVGLCHLSEEFLVISAGVVLNLPTGE